MALSMADATQARSISGQKTAIATLAMDIKKMKSTLAGDKYNNVKSVIASNWVGPDADSFVQALDKRRDNISKKLDELYKYVMTAIDNDQKQFDKFQSGMANLYMN